MRSLVSLAAAVALAGGISLGAQSAQAIPFGFELQENDDNADDLSSQFVVDVLDHGGGEVTFRFDNNGPDASSITAIYFHDATGVLVPPLSIHEESAGVSFDVGATPPNLPGGNDIDPAFIATAGLTADSNPPVQPNGINPGEYLTILIAAFNDFNSVIAALMSGDLRIGMHVQGLVDGASQTYTNLPNPIPLPAGLVLFLSGLAGVGFLGRYKARRRETAAA